MADDNLAELLKTQKSLTEWFEDIGHKDTEALRREDNDKRKRLSILGQIIDLPIEMTIQFEASDLAEDNKKFRAYLNEHGSELCALRLLPKQDDLPKLRMRGKSVKDAYAWFLEQDVDPSKYLADFIAHPPDYKWATIFVVNKYGIQGEIIWGGHHQLTQGFHHDTSPHVFRYDYKNWMIYPENPTALEHLKSIAKYIHIPDKSTQNRLKKELGAHFINDYLEGYLETTESSLGTWFIDYNLALGKLYEDLAIEAPSKKVGVKGLVGSPGKAEGPVCIVDPGNINKDFPDGAVLVCKVTTPNYVPLMQKAVAIVTDQGGILSHAAIVARELKKPCIVGTKNATKVLKNGQVVSVDANSGIVNMKPGG
ncbi:hypothetical protein HY857_00445 [Candidatus Saccharibacteria bacterium]|nr:hypothetical protein [Candidatus Saccharibacteria bacterium]